MRRRLRAVVAGLLVVGAGTATGTAAAAGAGPVAMPPSAPQTQTVSGVAANGVQLSLTAPAQLPLDLPGQQLPEREADVTVKDVGGQGYSGTVTMTLTSEGAGASAASLRLDHYDPASGSWVAQTIPAGQPSFTVTDTASVPANGTQVLKLRMSPGTTVAGDVKLSVAANGASAVATMPVTGPTFQASGLTASTRAGSQTVVTGKLANPTDLDLQHVSVKLLLCWAGSAGCVAHAADVEVDAQVQSGGAWHTVTVADGTAANPMTATVIPDVELPAGGALSFSARVTVGAGAFGQAPAQPSSQAPPQAMSVPLVLGPVGLTLAGQPAVSGTLTVQPPPGQPPSSTPSSTPSTPSTAATSTPSDPATPTDTPTTTPTGSPAPTPDPVSTTEAASTPGAASSSSNPTILVAAGLLAVCLALVLWWVSMKRRERMARVVAEHGDSGEAPHEGEV